MMTTAPAPAAPATSASPAVRYPLPLPRPASSFFADTRAAATAASGALDLMGHEWQAGSDTTAARAAISTAMQSAARAVGQPAPTEAIAAARDGEAFLRQAFGLMEHLRADAPATAARPFVAAAVDAFDSALREYSARLEPTPAYI